MNGMLIAGLLVVAESDNVYRIIDAKGRDLGAVVRHWVPSSDHFPSAIKRFRAFGEDFETLRAAVDEYTKIGGVGLRDAKGDIA